MLPLNLAFTIKFIRIPTRDEFNTMTSDHSVFPCGKSFKMKLGFGRTIWRETI